MLGAPLLLLLAWHASVLTPRVQHRSAAAQCCQRETPAPPRASAGALETIKEYLDGRGRCSFAEVGELLRSEGLLPREQALGPFLAVQPELVISGKRNNLQVALASQTRETALVRFVSEVLRESGPITTTELKLRLSERGRTIPGLLTLLRSNNATFVIESGVVALSDALLEGDWFSKAAQPLLRLQALDLSDCMAADSLPDPRDIAEVVLLDMDNKAYMLESSAAYAARGRPHTLVLAFCSTAHNPRLPRAAAELCRALSKAGWLRVISPARDTKNAADFVLAFWVGWLHARLPKEARFTLLSTDIHLDQTVLDLLRSQGRESRSNPATLE